MGGTPPLPPRRVCPLEGGLSPGAARYIHNTAPKFPESKTPGKKMQDIQTGDLVKYNDKTVGHADKGVWLVVSLDPAQPFGELATLQRGSEKRLCHISYLIKI